MERRKNRESPFLLLVLITAMLFLFLPFGMGNAKTANAEEVEKTQAERIIAGSDLLTFRKGENAEYGRFTFGCFFVLDSVYDASCTYGSIICPKSYVDKLKELGASGDYIAEFAKYNVTVANILGTSALPANGGKIFKLGLINMYEQNLDREFAHIFYVKDTAGNTAYLMPKYVVYNQSIAKDYSNAELKEMLDERLGMDTNFKKIVEKIEELVDSVWVYGVIAAGAVIVVWGAFVGIRIAVAKKNEEKINARGMVKGLIIGTIVVFVLAVGLPLLIKGLGAWVG